MRYWYMSMQYRLPVPSSQGVKEYWKSSVRSIQQTATFFHTRLISFSFFEPRALDVHAAFGTLVQDRESCPRPSLSFAIDDERMMSFVHSHAVSGLILESYTTLPPSIQLGASKTFGLAAWSALQTFPRGVCQGGSYLPSMEIAGGRSQSSFNLPDPPHVESSDSTRPCTAVPLTERDHSDSCCTGEGGEEDVACGGGDSS